MDYITVDEAAELTGWTRATLYSKASRRQIPSYRIGRSLRFRRQDMLNLFRPRPALRPLADKEGGES
ncbi:MAG: helix-turn-helix domain-containing protein [candidate division NC10 bacterium]|nr:helix-turn-helix domain-containing protein [candidate division NC10 bacterium]